MLDNNDQYYTESKTWEDFSSFIVPDPFTVNEIDIIGRIKHPVKDSILKNHISLYFRYHTHVKGSHKDDMNIDIYKYSDEWFNVHIYYPNWNVLRDGIDTKFYKCDQFDGLLKLLHDVITK